MKKNAISITHERIPIDTKRRVSETEGTKVLLWDNEAGCYYETTVKDIIARVLRRLDERFDEYRKELNGEFSSHKEEIQAEIVRFEGETAKISKAMIELAESIGGK